MAYSTLADVEKALPEDALVQLTDDENIGIVNEERVTRAIDDADEEIDGYLGSRHTVPLEPVPGIIRKLSADIAAYNLYARRLEEVPDTRATRYKNAVRFLEQVAKGAISLGAEDPDGTPVSDTPEFSAESPQRLFDRDKLEGF
jgi:phage gp36-like protein